MQQILNLFKKKPTPEDHIDTAYRLQTQKRPTDAAYSYIAAALHKDTSAYDSATLFVKAGDLDPIRKVEYYQRAMDIYMEQGKFCTAAKLSQKLAESFYHSGDTNNALIYYEKAVTLFEDDNMPSHVQLCNEKIAIIYSSCDKYKEAAKLFEQIATNSLKSNTGKYIVKDHYFKAGICYLCTEDSVALRLALTRFVAEDATFASKYEYKLLSRLCDAYDDMDSDLFTQILTEYNTILPLDNWKVDNLMKVKKSMVQNKDDELL